MFLQLDIDITRKTNKKPFCTITKKSDYAQFLIITEWNVTDKMLCFSSKKLLSQKELSFSSPFSVFAIRLFHVSRN